MITTDAPELWEAVRAVCWSLSLHICECTDERCQSGVAGLETLERLLRERGQR